MTDTLFLSTAPGTGSPIGSFVFLAVMLAVFYFLILRPQRARMRAQQSLSASLAVGDRVQTIGGIQGIVRSLEDDSVVIEVEQGRIRVARRAISSKLEPKE
ncbi:MAG TPA: preprotein translocase subunit YajC [Acidimicrobiia bacterium]|nr:preprotein translocase subunit YajC [Acidimicrobiia bacterium]